MRTGYSSKTGSDNIKDCRRKSGRTYNRNPRKIYRRNVARSYVKAAECSKTADDHTFVRFMITAAFLGVIMMFLLSSKAKASEKADVTYYKYFKNVKIESGDTLASLADRYNEPDVRSDADYMDEVCTINNIRPDNIEAGDYVVVPYYSPEYK